MTDERAEPPASYRGVSVLIHGDGETAMAVLATALARAEVGSFGWVDCAHDGADDESTAHRILEEAAEPGAEANVRPEDLLPPAAGSGGLSAWLVRDPAAAESAARLAAYLRLPSLLQRVVSRVTTRNARAVIVLTSLDALPGPAVERALGSVEVHETLHREAVTLVATFRGEPSAVLRAPFDRVYRVRSEPDRTWREARVTLERGDDAAGNPPEETLGQRFPWLARLPDPDPSGHPIPRHKLR